MTKYFLSIILFLCLAVTGLQAQGPFYTAMPDSDGNGSKDLIGVGQTVDFNTITFTYPGNVNIRLTGDSITFMAIFIATGCNSYCANESVPYYHSDGQMYGWAGVDRANHGWFKSLVPGEYLMVASTKNGYALRETFEVSKCGSEFVNNPTSNGVLNNTDPHYFTAIPDSNGDGYKDTLIAGQVYDINDLTKSFPGNVNIRLTGDSIQFLAIFYSTGCNSFCADQSVPYYQSNGQMYGMNGIDKRYHGSVVFPVPGDYLLVGSTKNGHAIRETFTVSNCTNLTNTVYVYVTDTVYVTDPNSVATLQLDICEELASQLQATSLNDLSNVTFELVLAPNPTSTMVKVLLDNDGLSVFEKLQIVSMNGQVLLESTSIEVNVSKLPSATYIARINFQKNLVVNQPFIKQ